MEDGRSGEVDFSCEQREVGMRNLASSLVSSGVARESHAATVRFSGGG